MENRSEKITEFMAAHKELSLVIKYPPFSTSISKRNTYRDELLAEELKINLAGVESLDNPYAGFRTSWQKDIDKALGYMQQYGENIWDAREAGLKAAGKSPDDNDVPLDI
jgi:hypothetical protein